MDDERLTDADSAAVQEITEAQDAVYRANAGLASAVYGARKDGVSWSTIGATLGVTRQAAQQRFSFVEDSAGE